MGISDKIKKLYEIEHSIVSQLHMTMIVVLSLSFIDVVSEMLSFDIWTEKIWLPMLAFFLLIWLTNKISNKMRKKLNES